MSKQRRNDLPPTGFGVLLKREREKAGLSQRELAEKVGVHQFTIAKIEQGVQEPGWPVVLAVARILGVSADVFTEAVQVEEPPPPGRPKKADAPPPAPRVSAHKTDDSPKRGRPKKPVEPETAPEKPAEKKPRKKGN